MILNVVPTKNPVLIEPVESSVAAQVIALIRKMSRANPRWGAPHIHGELLKPEFELSEATVAKYMVRDRKPPSQTRRTFLANHMQDMVSSDFFVVPTVFFRVLNHLKKTS